MASDTKRTITNRMIKRVGRGAQPLSDAGRKPEGYHVRQEKPGPVASESRGAKSGATNEGHRK